jgi:hypothetical protein
LGGDEEQVGGFDLVYKNGLVKFDSACLFTTYLGNLASTTTIIPTGIHFTQNLCLFWFDVFFSPGAANTREKNLRKLSKNFKKRQSASAASASSSSSAD